MIKLVLLMTAQSFLLVLGQIFLKKMLIGTDFQKITMAAIISIAGNYTLWTAITFSFLSAIIWIYVLKMYEFNLAYPMLSIGYILALVAGRLFFNEEISVYSIVGVVFIITGIMIVGLNKNISI
jgi:multidrug transporter EmrE-like cation transporter